MGWPGQLRVRSMKKQGCVCGMHGLKQLIMSRSRTHFPLTCRTQKELFSSVRPPPERERALVPVTTNARWSKSTTGKEEMKAKKRVNDHDITSAPKKPACHVSQTRSRPKNDSKPAG